MGCMRTIPCRYYTLEAPSWSVEKALAEGLGRRGVPAPKVLVRKRDNKDEDMEQVPAALETKCRHHFQTISVTLCAHSILPYIVCYPHFLSRRSFALEGSIQNPSPTREGRRVVTLGLSAGVYEGLS